MNNVGQEPSASRRKIAANWYVDNHCKAIISNGFSKALFAAYGIVRANFKSGLYCASFPFGNPTTICLPFGLHEAHLNKEFGFK